MKQPRKSKKIQPIVLAKPANNKIQITKSVVPITKGQHLFVQTIRENFITLALGPAGSGKSHISCGLAVEYFERGEIDKIIITRPCVEAGEKIGFLPGDFQNKMLPYLRPVYDELEHFVGKEKLKEWEALGVIEIAPIGYLRGRTLKRAFIIVDESQNLTHGQLKMVLTRFGKESKMVINGDASQSDLPVVQRGALEDYVEKLDNLEGMGIVHMSSSDIVRHEIVDAIIKRLQD